MYLEWASMCSYIRGRAYVAWTDDSYFLPRDFDEAEWQCFKAIHRYMMEHWTDFVDLGFLKSYQVKRLFEYCTVAFYPS